MRAPSIKPPHLARSKGSATDQAFEAETIPARPERNRLVRSLIRPQRLVTALRMFGGCLTQGRGTRLDAYRRLRCLCLTWWLEPLVLVANYWHIQGMRGK
jgi:hypothetical protein